MPLPADLQQSVDEIVYEIKKGTVIPIIGYDLLNEPLMNNGEPDFLKLLIKEHVNDDALLDRLVANSHNGALTGHELANEYYHSLGARKNSFKQKLSRTIKQERFKWKLIPDSYRKLVSIKHFELFINATFMNSVELAFNTYRGAGLSEEEIKSSYSVMNYGRYDGKLLEPASERGGFRLALKKPVVCNIFGTHDEIAGNYILTDADYVELIHELITNDQEKFSSLLSYLNSGYLLFLGCNFPDWFFRFFIRICVANRLDLTPIRQKAVIDSLNGIDQSRAVFINNYGIQKLDIDCNTLIDEIYLALNESREESLLDDEGNSKVFISYCLKDRAVAEAIAAQFDANYIEYFIDYRQIETGDSIDGKIKKAIDKCSVFAAIVSDSISSGSPYVCKEWNYAIDTDKLIIPVFKQFVQQSMYLPIEEKTSGNIRNLILNKDNTAGIPLTDDNKIALEQLKDIKEMQYKSRVSGHKRSN